MLSNQELARLIARIREDALTPCACEVQAAVHGVPDSLAETMCAFANGDGGLILLGLSEEDAFRPAEGFNAERTQEALFRMAMGGGLTPAVRLSADVYPFEGGKVVAAEVLPLPPTEKPCWVTVKGQMKGAFIRTDAGNARLSPYEIHRLVDERVQPKHDREPVEAADREDLSPELMAELFRRLQELAPSMFRGLRMEKALERAGALVLKEGRWVPTLGGLLVAGVSPQKYFPGLCVEVVSRTEGAQIMGRTVVGGPVPEMLAGVERILRSQLMQDPALQKVIRAEKENALLEALMEAVRNGLQHRDYSADATGTPVELSIYPDRFEITSPGGLYSVMTAAHLNGRVQSGITAHRNQSLSRLFEATPCRGGYVVEEPGGGCRVMRDSVEEAGLPPPIFKDSLSSLTVIVRKGNEENSQEEGHRSRDVRTVMLELFREHGILTAKDLIEQSGLSRQTIFKHLKAMCAEGIVEPLESRRSPRQRYQLQSWAPKNEEK